MRFDGDFNPLTGVAMHLKAAGHDVRWYAGPSYVARPSRRRHTRLSGDWSSDVCSSDLSREARVSCLNPGKTSRDLLQHVSRPESPPMARDRKSTRLNSSHHSISYA